VTRVARACAASSITSLDDDDIPGRYPSGNQLVGKKIASNSGSDDDVGRLGGGQSVLVRVEMGECSCRLLPEAEARVENGRPAFPRLGVINERGHFS
jgi:hypothetical protein